MSLAPGSVRSVERTLDLLVALEMSGRPVGVSELARGVDIPKATALRLLSVLGRRGFVQKEQGRYRLGTAVVTLAGAFLTGDSLSRLSLPILEELALASGETVSLSVRHGFDRVVIQRVNSPHRLRYTIRIGQRLPLELGASGRVLAAGMPRDLLQSFLDQLGSIRLATGETVTKESFTRNLEQIRQQGFTISREERERGVISIAAPVLARSGGTLAAIAVTGPVGRVPTEELEPLSVSIRQAARKIAEAYENS